MNIWNEISKNLVMVMWFMLPLTLCRLADILFGAVNAWKSLYDKFNSTKLKNSIISSAIMLLGMLCLVSGIVSLPAIMQYYNIDIIDTNLLNDMLNIVVVVTLLITTAITYGKDAFDKLSKLLKK